MMMIRPSLLMPTLPWQKTCLASVITGKHHSTIPMHLHLLLFVFLGRNMLINLVFPFLYAAHKVPRWGKLWPPWNPLYISTAFTAAITPHLVTFANLYLFIYLFEYGSHYSCTCCQNIVAMGLALIFSTKVLMVLKITNRGYGAPLKWQEEAPCILWAG